MLTIKFYSDTNEKKDKSKDTNWKNIGQIII